VRVGEPELGGVARTPGRGHEIAVDEIDAGVGMHGGDGQPERTVAAAQVEDGAWRTLWQVCQEEQRALVDALCGEDGLGNLEGQGETFELQPQGSFEPGVEGFGQNAKAPKVVENRWGSEAQLISRSTKARPLPGRASYRAVEAITQA